MERRPRGQIRGGRGHRGCTGIAVLIETSTPAELGVLGHLPSIAKGGMGLYLLDPTGELRYSGDVDESISFAVKERQLVVDTEPGRQAFLGHFESSQDWVVLTYDAAEQRSVRPFLDALFSQHAETEEARLDMESMFSSSLALLEEVSMMGEILPKLPTGETEMEVVQMGLEALIVAASVEAAIFVRYDLDRDAAEVLLHLSAGESARRPDSEVYRADGIPADGLAWRAIRGGGEAILEGVPHEGPLGAPGSPESLACREVIAVPVRYGGENPITLGALLVLDKRPNTYSNADRFGSQDTKLAASVAAMLGSVLGTRKVTELGNELRTAEVLQQQILPDGAPLLPGFDLAGRSTSSGAVGGDYFDYLPLPDGRLLCVVADVSGHNLASCLVMVGARAALRLLAASIAGTGEVFDRAGASLFPDLQRTELFITAAGVNLQPGSREVEIVNAGHNPTMIFRREEGVVEEIFAEETVFGFLPAPRHTVRRTEVQTGDVILMYTDGVTEAVNAEGEMLEEWRLRRVLRESADGTAAEILDAVFRAVSDFADQTAKGDDISAVVVKAI